jgi:hypothetical protein
LGYIDKDVIGLSKILIVVKYTVVKDLIKSPSIVRYYIKKKNTFLSTSPDKNTKKYIVKHGDGGVAATKHIPPSQDKFFGV